MNEELLREISEKYLLPCFSGATLEANAATSTARESTVSFINPQVIGFKVNRTDNYRLQFKRDQPFAQQDDPAREKLVIEAFTEIVGNMEKELASPLKDDLLSTFQRRVAAKAVAEPGSEKATLAVIDQLALWATRLYEGAAISSAIGISLADGNGIGLTLNDIAGSDFGAVLANGFDTLLEINPDLKFVAHRVLPTRDTPVPYCPWRHTAIAQWTSEARERVAVVLNRLGEILIFRQGQLLFARRGGTWHFLTHQPIIRQMSVPKDQDIRKAIYETTLDASFSRTGACLGVVSHEFAGKWTGVIARADLLDDASSTKSKAIKQIIGDRKFHDLHRTLRQELVAIDGATVIDHKGKVLAVGAILQIEGGSTGGGRTAAARQLGTMGLGVKVSQDGGITGFRQKANDATAFRVM
ncbi:MAG: hypothetical protein ABTS22_14155 [Accumulibacter sp.]|uniref:hypothetical protein n=1 Tax=Accumulibacter sp. TaxID=2053492 RepID=UPI003314DBC0